MSNTRSIIFLLLLLTLSSVQCQQVANRSSYPSSAYPSDGIPLPQFTIAPSKSAVIGRIVLISGNQRKELANTVVRLAPVQWNEQKTDGIFVLDTAHSPGTITRTDGLFTFINIEPADYVIIVGDVMGVHAIILESDGRVKIFRAEANQTLDVGTLEITWD